MPSPSVLFSVLVRGLFGLCLAAGAAEAGRSATATSPAHARLSVERIFGREDFKLQDWGPAKWLKGGAGYSTLESSVTLTNGQDLVRYDLESGRREVLVAATNLVPRGETQPLKVSDYAWSGDGRRVLIFTNTRRVWRQETRGDYWVWEPAAGTLRKLGGDSAASTLMFATFSPDGGRVAYVRENDLHVQSLDDLKVTRLTRDGSATVVNGTADWVNEEEFGLRHGFRWSPDGRRIAYWQFDTSGVREFKLINNTDGLYPEITSYAYPKAGQTNSATRVGIVDARGGRTRWLDVKADARANYIPGMEWATDSRSVLFQHVNRAQNTNRVLEGDARSGRVQPVFVDRDDAWVEAMESWRWIDQGRRFLWLSERDGWQHLYAVERATGQAVLLTPGGFDVVRVAGLDEARGWVYFVASPDRPTERHLFRAALDGQGGVERVSPADAPGTHGYDVSEDGRWAFHTWSRFGRPPVIDLVELPSHRSVRVLSDNADVAVRLAELEPCEPEFFRVDVGGGVNLDAWCLKPPGFDPARKYPLFLHVYGEPAGSTVVDAWGKENQLWHRFLAERGYVVMSVDNRGTAAPRGRDWRKSVHRQIGVLASADQAAAVRRILADRPYLDPARVGVWGWSGGGSMTLNGIFRYPDLYRMGMAVAFVSNQRFYDTIYQERYMGVPSENEEGFTAGSPITHAGQLKGNLLLVYGTGDDNCHYQNFEVLVNELVRLGKPFSQMSYPNRTHAIREGENTRRHLYDTLTRYLEQNLPLAP